MSAIRSGAMPRALVTARAVTAPRVTTVLLWLMVASEVLFLAGLLAFGGQSNALVTEALSLATQWIPVSIFWLVAFRTGFTSAAVVLAAAGVTLSAVGDTYYTFAMDADGYLQFPSPADAGYLLFYPLMVAALVVLVRRRLSGSGGIVLLESAVATLGASAALAVILDPVISGILADGVTADSAIAVSYPLFDLLLLAAMAGIAAVPTVSVGRRWWALIVGLSIFAAADISYALLENQGAYLAGSPLDAAWAIGLGFLTWWVSGAPGVDTDAPPPAPRRLLVPIPAVAVLAGLAVLIVATQVELSSFAVILGGATVGLAAVPIIFRQAMLGRVIAAQEEAVNRLTEIDRDKTDMMITMNHEFKTPLTSINGNVELLLDGDAGELPPLAAGMIRTIERNGARLQDLLDEMLTVSRLEAGGFDTARTPLYVSGMVTRAAALVGACAKSKGVELVTECNNFALTVDADGGQLERAFVSIIDNAVKFTPRGGRVDVSAEGPSDTGEIIVRVRDTGIGIPADDLPRLFTRFFRAANVQSAAIPGVGLGLSIIQRVVRAHEGSVTIESTLGVGTTVTVRLPASATGIQRMRPEL